MFGDSIAAGVGDRVDGYQDRAWADGRYDGIHVDFLQHPALDDDLFSADRLHINRRGHAIVAAEVIRALSHRLDRWAVPR